MKTLAAVPAGYTIERVDNATASDELVRQLVAFQHALDAERLPEDPPRPAEQIAGGFRITSQIWKREYFGLFHSGKLVGGATVGRNLVGSNLGHRNVDVAVHPEHRRRGLGRALFAQAVDAVGDGEDILVNGWTSDRVPAGAAFAERVGAKAGLRMRTSQLDLKAVDRALIREWASLDPQGYRIEWILDGTPDHLMDNVLEALRAINRMPREGLQMEDWTFTAETIRESERTMKARGLEDWFILALHDSGGSAGFTDIAVDRAYLHVLHQRGTAVVPEHQGKGVGKWMKALMIEKVLRELPEARFIRTENAGTNAAMLGINVKMGFRPAWENVIWQLPLVDAKRYAGR
jgi:GNAT superfamily N-acetyltransferase